ncbi:MAG TPA: YihY/virulence factor BrkB family protein [Myxococcota bacterium]|nr:YihY/virulence factor BrkB family protein [Myxococcota bacterium]
MRAWLAKAGAFVREVFDEWSKDDALSLGAALAYYTIFSMAPLLVLVIAIVGLVFGRAAAQGEIVAQIQDAIGPAGAQMIEGMVARASQPSSGAIATVVSLVTMFFGATGVFGQLQSSLNKIWEVQHKRRGGLRGQLSRRLSAFAMILGIGVLLFLSLAASAALAFVHGLLDERFPVLGQVLPFANFALSFGVITALFAMILKTLPDVRIEWGDVWLGAAVTALLFTIGKALIALYLGRAGVTSVYGAAGSLVLVLLWIYYSAQLLFLGAEFTEVYSRRFGSRQGEKEE